MAIRSMELQTMNSLLSSPPPETLWAFLKSPKAKKMRRRTENPSLRTFGPCLKQS
jgi:hypothetical protein